MTDTFVHRIRVRYAEVDGQGVVFNAHWLTYCDDACTRFMDAMGFGSIWIDEFDVMLVKAVLEWSGPAAFDEWIDIAVTPARIGTKSFDLRLERLKLRTQSADIVGGRCSLRERGDRNQGSACEQQRSSVFHQTPRSRNWVDCPCHSSASGWR